MKRLLITSLASVVGAATVLAASGSAASAADREVVLTQGHIDLFDVTYDQVAGKLRLAVGDDTGAAKVFRDPSTVTVAVDEELSATTVPDIPAYSFLGEPGDTVYLLPFSQNPDLPWPGWSTERLVGTLPAGTQVSTAADAVKLDVAIEGPGEVHSYQSNAFGSPINHYIDTSDAGPDTIPIARNAHVHTEWSFSELGEYTFSVTPTAATTTGGTLSGDTATYHLRVGDPVVAPGLGLGVTANKPSAEYLYGQGITLTATPDAATDLDHYHWFVKGAGQAEYVISNRSATNELKLPTSTVWDGAQVVAKLYGDDHEVVAESAPVTLSVDTLEPTTVLTATTDRASYQVGETAALTSTQSPQTADDHYHWYVRKPGEEFYTWIDGTRAADATLPITADLQGAEVVARLFNADHAVLAESAPIVLSVGPAAPVAATSTVVRLSQTSQRYGATPSRADVTVTTASGAAAGRVSVSVDGTGLGAHTLDGQGRASVALPARLAPGAHQVVASFVPADDAAQAPSSSAAARVTIAKARARVALTLKKRVRTTVRARAMVKVAGVGTPTGKVRVLVDGKKVAAASLRNGRVVVRLPRLSAGRHSVRIRFGGDEHHAASTSKLRKLRVTRR
ncbi:choice-of-anchor M domain-containing protein [Nocardioides sp. W7]|uniref:choice-of-anchor M domain-containing protein n=1 Tax=Nocardioides sp. W7 TaxID=2931390 RepID=UPI001FD15BA4|nr:choice-of-anchor M domain-containing protein [Nocardioides sp. W7]